MTIWAKTSSRVKIGKPYDPSGSNTGTVGKKTGTADFPARTSTELIGDC
jgi:hypothetical protein